MPPPCHYPKSRRRCRVFLATQQHCTLNKMHFPLIYVAVKPEGGFIKPGSVLFLLALKLRLAKPGPSSPSSTVSRVQTLHDTFI